MSAWRHFIAILLLVGLVGSVVAENSTRADGYTIHHNAFTSTFLSPEVAQLYGIQRSRLRGMVNISVIREIPGTTGEGVPARVELEVMNLLGQIKRVELREIREPGAVYYIGEFPIIDRELVNFTIRVMPEGGDRVLNARFSHEFYAE